MMLLFANGFRPMTNRINCRLNSISWILVASSHTMYQGLLELEVMRPSHLLFFFSVLCPLFHYAG
jgi:hypothetical protein